MRSVMERKLPLTPTLSPQVGRGRDPRAAWEGEGQPAREQEAK
jgi:hypothetical protein